MKNILFNWIFTKEEQTAIINALWHRSNEESEQNNKEQNKYIMTICKRLAKELMS
ncbi:MAG: hypothetical protein AABY22_24945 [Nanoarchaeota archaeon]